ncbi:MAG: hypothetical protein JRF63_06035, partial [Deltaproteobacteria bacterium]|nr:hypothetical protein [Deltaproteobacteria bacterium]
MLLLVSALMVGCYDTSVSAPEPPDSGADSDSDADTDYDSDFDGDTDQCSLLYDVYSGNAITSYVYDGSSIETFDSQWNGTSWDSVAVLELIDAAQGDVVDLQFQAQYKTCDYCVLVFLDCPIDDLNLCDKA